MAWFGDKFSHSRPPGRDRGNMSFDLLDLLIAFDTINHGILLESLHELRIGDTVIAVPLLVVGLALGK